MSSWPDVLCVNWAQISITLGLEAPHFDGIGDKVDQDLGDASGISNDVVYRKIGKAG